MGTHAAHLARALAERHAQRQRAWTERATHVRDVVAAAVHRHVHPDGGARVWLIGSLAWGRFGPRSDVDLVVDGLDPAQLDALEAEIVRLAQVPVDLLRLAELPPAFHARVLAEGVALHGPRSP